MKHLQKFESYRKTDEGFKDYIAAGAITLASLLPQKALSQDVFSTWNKNNIQRSIDLKSGDFSRYNLPNKDTKMVNLTKSELEDVFDNLEERGFVGTRISGSGTFIICTGDSEKDVIDYTLLPCFEKCRIIEKSVWRKGDHTVTIASVEYKFNYYYDMPVSRKEIKRIESGDRHMGDVLKTWTVTLKNGKDFKVTASDENQAKEMVCNANGCDLDQVVSVDQNIKKGRP